MSVAQKILSNTFIQISGKIFGALISVLIVKLITNFLGVGGYGEYVSIYEFLAFFGIMADLGLFTIGVREMAKYEDKTDYILGNILTLRTIVATIAMLLAIGAAFLIPQYQGTFIPVGIAIASLSVFFSILNGTVSSVLQVHLKMQYPTIGLIVGKVVSFSYMVWVVFYGFTDPTAEAFYQLLWAGVIGNIFMVSITWFYAAKYAKIRFLFDFAYWKDTIWKALPYGLALILNMVYFRIDSILLLLMKSPEEVGLYGVPMRVLDILSIIPVYFMNSVLPTLTRRLKEGAHRAQEVIQHSFDFLMAMVVPIVVGAQVLAFPLIFIISSPEFLSRLNEGFYGSDIALRILVFAMLFAFMSAVFTFTLIAIGYQGKLLYISAAGAIFNIIANILVIPEWGFRGAAATSVISEALIVILAAMMLRKHFPYKLRLKSTFKIIISALVMGGVIHVLLEPTFAVMQNFNFFVLLPLGVLIYTAMLWITGVVDKERLRLMRGR
jgi:O-antigen/teichoic acid export membrane protein